MATAVVALSGRVCVGKTTLAERLTDEPGGIRLSTREVLKRELKYPLAVTEREALQTLGHLRDLATAGAWVADAVSPAAKVTDSFVIVDAVRVRSQLEHLKRDQRVMHIHLTAP